MVKPGRVYAYPTRTNKALVARLKGLSKMIKTVKKLRYVAVMEDGTYVHVSIRNTHTGEHVEIQGTMQIEDATVFYTSGLSGYGRKVNVSRWKAVPVIITIQYERISDEEAANVAGIN